MITKSSNEDGEQTEKTSKGKGVGERDVGEAQATGLLGPLFRESEWRQRPHEVRTNFGTTAKGVNKEAD
jgi:hypothetical protein